MTYRTTTGDASTSSLDCRCEEGNLVSVDGSTFMQMWGAGVFMVGVPLGSEGTI